MQYSLISLFYIISAFGIFLCAIITMGAGSGLLVMAFGIAIALTLPMIRKRGARKAWLAVTGFCAIQPLFLLAVFVFWLPRRWLDIPLLMDFFYCFYGSTIAVSGPIGLFVTSSFDFLNFPYDENWDYMWALLVATTTQWAAMGLLGNHLMKGDENNRIKWLMVLGGSSIVLFGITYFFHMLMLTGSHM